MRLPWHGGHRRRACGGAEPGAPRGRLGRAARTGGRAGVGGQPSNGPSPRPRRRRGCRRAPARASGDDLQAEGVGRTARVAPVVPSIRRGSRAGRYRRSRATRRAAAVTAPWPAGRVERVVCGRGRDPTLRTVLDIRLPTASRRSPFSPVSRALAHGKVIFVSVLSVLRCPSVGARPAVFSGQVDCVPIRAARRGPGIQPGMISRRSSSRLASAELLRGLNCLSQTNRVTPGVDRLFEQMIEVRAEARAGPARRCGLRPGVPRRPARRRRSARSSSWPAGWFACDGRPRSDVRVERHRPDAEFAAQFGHQRVAVGHPRRLRGVVRDSARASCRTAPPVRIPVLRGRRGA